MPLDVKALTEQAVVASRFNGRNLVGAVVAELGDDPVLADSWRRLEALLGEDATRALAALVRNCFLIEPVNPSATSTKFNVRWAPDLPHPPTSAPFEECASAFERLLREIAALDAGSSEIETLRRFLRSRVLPYEAPIDYRERLRDGIHRDANMTWIWDDPEIVETVALRELLRDPDVAGDEASAINLALDKIVVKTYLTDRALTGSYRTNREKRWETHSDSVQFALRRDCLRIEHQLLLEICSFDGFPEVVRERLVERGLHGLDDEAYRDPITLDPLSYSDFRESLENPVWGRNAFQVGHLNPLKAGAEPGTASGHTAENIGWISEDGNRIQGHLALDEVRSLLQRVAENYRQLGL